MGDDMRLRKGADVLKPKKKIGLFVSATVRRKGMDFALCHVGMKEMQSVRSQMPKKDKLHGLPHLIAIDRETSQIHFFPAAHENLTVELYYHPPIDKM